MAMNEILVDRLELLSKIQKNRDTHRQTFLKAQDVFRKQVISALDKMLEDARNGVQYSLHVGLPEPQDMTQEYDTVIRMLEMSVDVAIKISQAEFKMYVMDQWNWKSGWELTNRTYGVTQ